jgi:hypothetical protein
MFYIIDGTLLSCMIDPVQLKHLLIVTSDNVIFLALGLCCLSFMPLLNSKVQLFLS